MLARMSFTITISIFLAGLICSVMFGCANFLPKKDTSITATPPPKQTVVPAVEEISPTPTLEATKHGLSQPAIEILQVGTFHSDEVSVETGEVWLGLYYTPNGYELIPSKITVDRVYDPLYDGDDEQTGKKVSIDSSMTPLFLVKGLEVLKRGVVATLFVGRTPLLPGKSQDFTFDNSDPYHLAASGKINTDSLGFTSLEDYRIELSRQSLEQVLISYRLTDYAIPSLLWAGDLDRDSKLDLLIDATNHYNVYSAATLFLSSVATSDSLLERVAMFSALGC